MCRRRQESNKYSGCYFLAIVLFLIWCLCAMEESQQKIPKITVYWGSWFWVKSPRGTAWLFMQNQLYGSLILVFGARQSLSLTFFGFSRLLSGLYTRDFQVLCKPPLALLLPWTFEAVGEKQHMQSSGNKTGSIFHFPNTPEKCSLFVYRWCCLNLEKELHFPMALWSPDSVSLGGRGPTLSLCKPETPGPFWGLHL